MAKEALEKQGNDVQYYCNLCRVDMAKWSELCPNCKAMGHTWYRAFNEAIPESCENHDWQLAYSLHGKDGWLCATCGDWGIKESNK